jgi:hypothetical protein
MLKTGTVKSFKFYTFVQPGRARANGVQRYKTFYVRNLRIFIIG